MSDMPHDPVSVKKAEVHLLASELARARGELLAVYETELKLPRDEALARIRSENAQMIDRIRSTPVEHVTWLDLDALAEHSPELAYRRWEEVLQAAREERQSGHRAAHAVEISGSPCWRRARFLVLREELHAGWRPRNSVEGLWLDTLAQAQHEYETWMERLTMRTEMQRLPDRKREDEGYWSPPRVSAADAVEQAAAMVDRFHKLMTRTLRTLHDLRRRAPVVMVQNAAQVNVGQQQINAVSD